MNKLLTANFARLKKDKVFWIGMAFMFAAGIFGVIMKITNDPTATADQLVLIFPVLIGIVTAAFCSLFIGTEYSDGTIRNKLIVGHTRSAVYLSNFITCSVAGVMMCLSYIAAVAAFGLPVLGLSEMSSMGAVAVLILVAFIMVIASTALFTLLCMLNQNKATAAVTCILIIVALLVLATMINARLEAPQYFDNYVLTDSQGYASAGQLENPQYLTGMKREIYQFYLDFLPTGQAIEISTQSPPNLWRMPLYSLFITLIATGCGLFCFRKKDLK